MKVTLAALLLVGTVMAAPWTQRRRAAHDERMGRRAAGGRNGTTLPPLAVNYQSLDDTIVIGPTSEVEYSSNWAGAIQISTDITQVSAVANVPSVSVPSGESSDGEYGGSAWVGIDGDTCSTAILQTGVDWFIENGETTYAAWYEWYPEYSYNFDITIAEGDSISMKVVATSKTSGTAYITNESTGESVSHSFTGQTSLCEYNAEWIVEDFEEGDSLISFAKFSEVTFTDAAYVVSGSSEGLSGATIIDIEQDNKVLTSCSTSGTSTLSCSYE